MKPLTDPSIEIFRVRTQLVLAVYGSYGDHLCGCFIVDGYLKVVASSAEGWDHVSVSCEDRCPTWDEMERIKRLFFKDGETAMQLHVPIQEHINCHPYTLHIWRPTHENVVIPRPPPHMVGPVFDDGY